MDCSEVCFIVSSSRSRIPGTLRESKCEAEIQVTKLKEIKKVYDGFLALICRQSKMFNISRCQ